MLFSPTKTKESLVDDNKLSDVMERVRKCNELGMTSVQNGLPHDGVQHFLDALYCFSFCSDDYKESLLPFFSRTFDGQQASPSPNKRRKINDNENSILSRLSIPHELQHRDVVCQTSEYDEGMNTFSSFLSIDAVEHPVRAQATVLLNLAVVHVALKDYYVAFSCFRQSLETTTAHADDTDMRSIAVNCLHGMGNLYFQCKRMDDSTECFQAALDICDNGMNAQQQERTGIQTAHILNSLGVLQFQQCRPCNVESIASLFRRALTIQRKLFSESNPDAATATTLNNLGRVLCVGGRMDEALLAYLEAFDIRVRTLGHDHLDVAATAYNIGQTLQQRKKFDQALEYYNYFIFIASKKLGRLHIDVVLTLKCMAQIHEEYRRFDQSLAIYNVALKAAEESVDRQVEVASILNKIGNIYFEMGDFDKATETYETGLQVERAHLAKNHPNIGVTLSNLGLILHRRGDLLAAKRRYKEALQVQKKCYGESDVRVAKTWFSLGNIELSMRDYAMALVSYQQALRIRRQNASGDDLDVATTLNSVGLALFKMGIHNLALRAFSECLRIRRTLLGPMARDVAIPLFNIGMIHNAMGSDDEALKTFQQVHRIELQCKDKGVGYTLHTLAQLYESRGNNEMALLCYEEILQNLNEDDVNDEPDIVRTLLAMANMHLRCGETALVVERACEATRVRQRHGKELKGIVLTGLVLFDLSKICKKAAAAA